MIKVKSKVKLNLGQIKQLDRAAVMALVQTAESLHKEIVQAQVVPRKDGALQGEKFFVDASEAAQGRVTLVHDTRYARRLYYHPEYQFHTGSWTDEKGKTHDGNPNAKGKWFGDWQAGGSKAEFAPDAFREFYRRLSGL